MLEPIADDHDRNIMAKYLSKGFWDRRDAVRLGGVWMMTTGSTEPLPADLVRDLFAVPIARKEDFVETVDKVCAQMIATTSYE
jgi:hypothetical protein